jgi:AcrR family transcriptional regulator
MENASIPPPPWQRVPAPRAPRRREPITQSAIVGAAMRVLDAEGLEALTMRRLADELDTGAGALYRHIGSKDGLLDLVLDHVIGEIEREVPDPDPERWREQLKDVGRSLRAGILRHRDVVQISVGRIPMGPNALRYMERVLPILRAGGVPDRLAVLGLHLLIAAVNGFTLDEGGGSAGADPAALAQQAHMARDYLASLPPESFPSLVSVADHFTISDPDERFDLLLDLFVEGLAQRARG